MLSIYWTLDAILEGAMLEAGMASSTTRVWSTLCTTTHIHIYVQKEAINAWPLHTHHTCDEGVYLLNIRY